MRQPTSLSRIHARTRVLAVISLALVAAGIWNTDGSLGAMGIAGWVFILAAKTLGRANLKSLTVSVDASHRATAGMAFPLKVTLANPRRWVDARWVDCKLNWPGDARSTLHFNVVAANATAEIASFATPRTRGDGSQIKVSLSSEFPFGLFTFETTQEIVHPLCVIPRSRSPRESPNDGVVLDASEVAGATSGLCIGDLRGLRAWSGGDRLRQIIWPASLRSFARGAGPIIREMDPPGFFPERCLIVFHSFSGGGALIHPEHFDRALELATGWIETLRSTGIRSRFIADFDGWQIRNTHTRSEIIEMRERFARAKRRHSTEAHEMQQAVTHITEGGEMVILISDMPPQAWQHNVPALPKRPVISNIHAR